MKLVDPPAPRTSKWSRWSKPFRFLSNGMTACRHAVNKHMGPGTGKWKTKINQRGTAQFGFLSDTEDVFAVKQKFAVVLVLPVARTLFGILLILLTWPKPWIAVVLVSTAAILTRRLRSRHHNVLIVVLGLAAYLIPLLLVGAAVSGLPAILQGMLGLACFLTWLAFDIAQWHAERFIVTTDRLWHPSGFISNKHPSVAVRGATFTSTRTPWCFKVTKALRKRDIGYLHLDTNVQGDQPMQKFGPVEGVTELNKIIHQAAGAALGHGPAPTPIKL